MKTTDTRADQERNQLILRIPSLKHLILRKKIKNEAELTHLRSNTEPAAAVAADKRASRRTGDHDTPLDYYTQEFQFKPSNN